MARGIEDFIRDECEVEEMLYPDEGEEFIDFDDEEVIAECDFCGEEICGGDVMTGLIFAGIDETKTLRICPYCIRARGGAAAIADVLDNLGGESMTDDAEEVEEWIGRKCEEHNAHRRNMLRITTARIVRERRTGVETVRN